MQRTMFLLTEFGSLDPSLTQSLALLAVPELPLAARFQVLTGTTKGIPNYQRL
jgi:hypothetical protein